MRLVAITLFLVLAIVLVGCSNGLDNYADIETDTTADADVAADSETIIIDETENQMITDDFVELGEMI